MDLIKLLEDHGYIVSKYTHIDGREVSDDEAVYVSYKFGTPSFNGSLAEVALQLIACDVNLRVAYVARFREEYEEYTGIPLP